MVGDCLRTLNEAVIGGYPKDLIYKKKNKTPFFFRKGHWAKLKDPDPD